MQMVWRKSHHPSYHPADAEKRKVGEGRSYLRKRPYCCGVTGCKFGTGAWSLLFPKVNNEPEDTVTPVPLPTTVTLDMRPVGVPFDRMIPVALFATTQLSIFTTVAAC